MDWMHAQMLQAAQLPQPASVHAVCPFASEFAVKSGVFEAVLQLVSEASKRAAEQAEDCGSRPLSACSFSFSLLLLLCFLQLQSWSAAATAWSVEMLLTAVCRLCTLDDGDAVRQTLSQRRTRSCVLGFILHSLACSW